MNPAKNTICPWCDRKAEEATRFYAATSPDSSVVVVSRAQLGSAQQAADAATLRSTAR